MPPSNTTAPRYTVPGLDTDQGEKVIELLRPRLHALNDLALTLKHIHWNVVGPHFIAVHEMLDPQAAAVREMVDGIAERIATLGGEPRGTAGALVAERTWEDYGLGRADAMTHLGSLDLVYSGVIEDHRRAASEAAEIDPVTEDLLVEHLHALEQFQWFVRAHRESGSGDLSGAETGHKGADAGSPPSARRTAKKATSTKRAPRKTATAKRTR
ncbi:Dps family protein [Streptomyces sp. NPDC002431]